MSDIAIDGGEWIYHSTVAECRFIQAWTRVWFYSGSEVSGCQAVP